MKNTRILEEIVSTQYNDLRGLIAIDQHSGSELFSLCKENGINDDEYFFLGFGLSEFTINGIGEFDSVYCRVLLLEKSKYGNTFDEINRNIRTLNSVDVVKKSFSVKYSDLGKYIKRFDFMALSDMGGAISAINIIE